VTHRFVPYISLGLLDNVPGDANFIYSDGMGFVDFYVSENSPVLYITESDILLKNVYVRKIEQLSEVSLLYFDYYAEHFTAYLL